MVRGSLPQVGHIDPHAIKCPEISHHQGEGSRDGHALTLQSLVHCRRDGMTDRCNYTPALPAVVAGPLAKVCHWVFEASEPECLSP